MLLILKVIGILILTVLGILLALLLCVLFVPICYKADIEKKSQQNLKGTIRISWLLHIISFHILVDDKVDTVFKIFGIPVSFLGKVKSGKKKVKQQSRPSASSKKTEPKNVTRDKEKSIEEKNSINFDKTEETVDILYENFDEEKREIQTDEIN